jgi:hypothetical protein
MALNVAETRHVYVGPININGMGHQMNIKTAVGAALLGIFHERWGFLFGTNWVPTSLYLTEMRRTHEF